MRQLAKCECARWPNPLRPYRNLNKRKHNTMKRALNKYLKDEIIIIREGHGLSLLLKPLIDIDLDKLEKIASQNNIKIYFKEYFEGQKVLDLGFGGFEENEIDDAVKSFSQIWQKTKSN